MRRSGYTGFSEDDGCCDIWGCILRNDTGSEKAVSRISTFFSSERSLPLTSLVWLKGKEKENLARAKKLGFPFSRQAWSILGSFFLFVHTSCAWKKGSRVAVRVAE